MKSHADSQKNIDVQLASRASAPSRSLANSLGRAAFSSSPQTEMLDRSSPVRQLQALQAMVDRSPQAQSLAQLKTIASPRPADTTPVNDDPRLEHEADVMGQKAAQAQTQSIAPSPGDGKIQIASSPMAPHQSPVQAKWILRNGSRVWVDDSYVLQPGESDAPLAEYFKQRPSVIVDKGKKQVRVDSGGKSKEEPLSKKPRTHADLQKGLEKQGAELRKRLKADPKSIDKATSVMEDVAGKLEKFAGDAVPKNHLDKIKKAHSGGPISGKGFRGIISGQDEFTQSEASSAFDRGLRRRRGNTPEPDRRKLTKFEQQSLRAKSAMRAPTRAIVNPVDVAGKMGGEQHPTTPDEPKLPGGSSGHSYEDRRRVESQVTAFDEAAQDPAVPPQVLLLSSMLAASVSTLSHMSAPLSASNVPAFNPSARERQRKEREPIKQATNLLASQLGIPTLDEEQDFNAPYKPHEAPASPRRLDEEATKEAQKKRAKPAPPPTTSSGGPSVTPTPPTPLSDPTPVTIKLPSVSSDPSSALASPPSLVDPSAKTLPPPVSSQPAKKALSEQAKDYQHSYDSLSQALTALVLATDLPRLHEAGGGAYFDQLLAMQTALAQIDRNDPARLGDVRNLYQDAYNWFAYLRNFVNRQTIGAGSPANNSLGARGRRWPSLRQFFSECGQMAAHNALALAGNVNDALAEDALNQLGGFGNNISEGNIRAILASVHRPDIPVIGSLEQLHQTVALFDAQDYHDLINQFQVGDAEFAGLHAVSAFLHGGADSLNAVVNTTGHLGVEERGHHWISVRFRRADDGQITVNYLDSFDADTDYTDLFMNYRQFFGHIPPNQ